MIDVLMPPPQYDYPYKGPLIEHVLPLAQVDAACTAMGFVRTPAQKYATIYGCQHTKDGICTIVIPQANGWQINDQDQAMVRRHELAHCKGWPNDHPGGGSYP